MISEFRFCGNSLAMNSGFYGHYGVRKQQNVVSAQSCAGLCRNS
jgi:hypothetical protein